MKDLKQQFIEFIESEIEKFFIEIIIHSFTEVTNVTSHMKGAYQLTTGLDVSLGLLSFLAKAREINLIRTHISMDRKEPELLINIYFLK